MSFSLATNVLQIGDVKALQNVLILADFWWLLYCLCAVIRCLYYEFNLKTKI